MRVPAFTVLVLLLTIVAGCKNKSGPSVASAAQPAVSTVPQTEESSSGTPSAVADHVLADDEDVRLNDQFVGPDANAEAVSDDEEEQEDTPDEDDTPEEQHALAAAFDPLADVDSPTAVEVKFVLSETTNILVAGRQFAYAQEIEKRNERVRENRQKVQLADAAAAVDAKSAENAPAAAPPPSQATNAVASVAPNAIPEPTAASAASAASAAPAAPATPAARNATQPAAAIDEKTILADKHGQWASSASASSTYAQSTAPNAGYSPSQATGAPNVDRYSDNQLSWATKAADSREPEWLQVGFARPVHATSIRVRQNTAPGAIARIDLIDDRGTAHVIWEGTDDTSYPKNAITWFVKDVGRTSYLVTAARVTLITARAWGWNEIDAVQLVGEP